MRIRSIAREYALQVLYEIEIASVTIEHALDDYFSSTHVEHLNAIKKFTGFLVVGVLKYKDILDEQIVKYARNWDIDRMAVVDKNILRVGIFELLYVKDIPPKVSINEAVEVAKHFGDVDSAKFVNGILDSVYRNESNENKTVVSPS